MCWTESVSLSRQLWNLERTHSTSDEIINFALQLLIIFKEKQDDKKTRIHQQKCQHCQQPHNGWSFILHHLGPYPLPATACPDNIGRCLELAGIMGWLHTWVMTNIDNLKLIELAVSLLKHTWFKWTGSFHCAMCVAAHSVWGRPPSWAATFEKEHTCST